MKIDYPYIPEGREILFVPLENEFMQQAKQMADENSACVWWPTGAVVVRGDEIIGRASNSGAWQPICPRVQNDCPTGEGYHFCKDVCQQTGHSELGAVDNTVELGNDPNGADLYLFGHWWCCQPCWDRMIEHGIKNVYLLDNAHLIFNRESRLKLMEDTQKRVENNETVEREETAWNID